MYKMRVQQMISLPVNESKAMEKKTLKMGHVQDRLRDTNAGAGKWELLTRKQ